MDIGSQVILVKDWPPARTGARGVVVSKDGSGNLGVRTTHDHEGNSWERLLPPAPPDTLRPA
jgi:hypothetical protein